MRNMKWGGVFAASLLSLTMLCTVIPEVSYAAVPAEEGMEESMIMDESTEKEDVAASENTEKESTEKEKSREAIDSTGRIEWDNISDEELENAIEIQDDELQVVNITEEVGCQIFKFIPEETKEYTFFGISSYDTYGRLRSDDALLDIDDDSGYSESDFLMTAELTAGKTYYCMAQM